jgi:hypothetical protein
MSTLIKPDFQNIGKASVSLLRSAICITYTLVILGQQHLKEENRCYYCLRQSAFGILIINGTKLMIRKQVPNTSLVTFAIAPN